MKTQELLLKLSKKYPSPQYAFLSQVRNQTGYSSGAGSIRTADALALGLWKSRGYHLNGFELKVSRSDWLTELKNPAKAEAIAEYCDMFSLVIPNMDIIDISEVPKTWGILLAKGNGMKTVREAPFLEAKQMDRPFLCGFMRSVTEQIEKNYTPTVEVEEIIEDRVESGIKYGIENAVTNAGRYEKLMENLEKFEKASGINLVQMDYGWSDPEKIGKAVKMGMDGKYDSMKRQFEYIEDSAKRLLKSVKVEIKKLDETD